MFVKTLALLIAVVPLMSMARVAIFPDPPRVAFGFEASGSEILKGKMEGEDALRAIFPSLTVQSRPESLEMESMGAADPLKYAQAKKELQIENESDKDLAAIVADDAPLAVFPSIVGRPLNQVGTMASTFILETPDAETTLAMNKWSEKIGAKKEDLQAKAYFWET